MKCGCLAVADSALLSEAAFFLIIKSILRESEPNFQTIQAFCLGL